MASGLNDYKNELERIYAQDYNKLYSCAYRLTGTHENAQDVLHNAYLSAFCSLEKFRAESTMYTWLYRILLNECYKFLKYLDKLPLTVITKNLGVSEKEFFESIPYTPSFEDDIIIDEMREKCLHAFMNCLNKSQRVCFILKTQVGLKVKEIAEVMEMSESNVKVTLFRARQHLKELFEMRCALIDPKNPCKCHLWIKYMNDHNIALPEGYEQPKTAELKKEHYKKRALLQKIQYLYAVEPKFGKKQFFESLKKVSQIL